MATKERMAGSSIAPSLREKKNGLDFPFYYVFQNGWRPILYGGALLLTSFLIVPALIILGYTFRVGQAAAQGEDSPPAMEDWAGLAIDGAKFAAVGVVAYIAVIVLGAIGSVVDTTVGQILVYILLAILVPATMTVFVATGSIRETFTTARIPQFIATGVFVKGVFMFLGVVIAASVIGVLVSLTIIGILFWYPFIISVYAAFWGNMYLRATDQGVVSSANSVSDRTTAD